MKYLKYRKAFLCALLTDHLLQVIVSVAADYFDESISGYDPPAGYYNGRYIFFFLASAFLLVMFVCLSVGLGKRAWVFPLALCGSGVAGIAATLIGGCLPDSAAARCIGLFGRLLMRLAACPLAALSIVIGRRGTAILVTVALSGAVSGVLFVLTKRGKGS